MLFENTHTGSAIRLGRLILPGVTALLLAGCGGGTPASEAAKPDSAAAPDDAAKTEAFISDGALNAAQQTADALQNEAMHRALQISNATGETSTQQRAEEEAARKAASQKHQEILKQAADEAAQATRSF